MHARLIVLFDKDKASNSKEARNYAFNALCKQNFAGEGTRFCHPIADWFVIGGRWSGQLTLARLNQAKLRQFYAYVREKDLSIYEAAKEFARRFPQVKNNPLLRDTYKKDGYEDDAQIVDMVLWKWLKKNCNFEDEDYYKGTACIDLDYDKIIETNVVGQKWAVVVDFHI